MTPTQADYVAVLRAAQDGMPLTVHQISILNALQRQIETSDDAAAAPAKIATPDIAAPAKTEISLLPAVLAKMEESCDLLREMRDMMRRRDPAALQARSQLGAMVETHREQASS